MSEARPQRRQWRTRALPLLIVVSVLLLWGLFFSPTTPGAAPVKVAAAKGTLIDLRTVALSPFESAARIAVLSDVTLFPFLDARSTEFLSADPLGSGEAQARGLAQCQDGTCSHLTFYNYTDGGTIEAIVDVNGSQVLTSWEDPLARPRATRLIVDKVLAIAARDTRVRETLGDLSTVEIAMVPMSIWLLDDDCRDDWCVDLTFPSPAGDGRILHVTVNMQDQRVARLFYTRGRPAASLVQTATPSDYFAELDPNAPLFTNGCHEADGWSICWEMTANDGLNVFDASFEDQLIFSSAKIAQVEVYYPAWPGGYRDEIGFNASVPPKFDTRIVEIDGGFELRQIFTEPFDWPTCVCCYRYEQVVQFYSDGSFEFRFISYGPGCDDLSVYRPFWRVDAELGSADSNEVYQWNDGWSLVENELDRSLHDELSPVGQLLATVSDTLHYRWSPVPTDPLGLDEGLLFALQHDAAEGAGPIEAGPADTFEPPRQWIDEEDQVSGENVVIWFVPFLKTKKANPWYCMPEPAPDLSPCESIMRVVPSAGFEEPEETEVATPAPSPAPTDPAATAEVSATATPAATITPHRLAGDTAEAIISNAGCGACHVIGSLGEEGKVGPDLSNIADIAGERVPDLTAEEYLRQSILEPNAFIAPECPNSECLPNIMPHFADRLTGAQIDTLVAFLLQQGEPAPTAAAVGDTLENGEAGAAATPAAQDTTDTNDSQSTLVGVLVGIVVVGGAVAGFFLLRRRQEAPPAPEE